MTDRVEILLCAVLGVLALFTVAALLRLIVGPHTVDRMVCINMITSFTVMMLGVLACLYAESYIADLNLIYGALGLVSVAVLSRLRTGHREKDGVAASDDRKEVSHRE